MGRTQGEARDFRIVILCGSAGAVSAYCQILRVVPHDSGMAFVVLIHRRTTSIYQLIRMLSRVTAMPVQEIYDGAVLLPNRIHVMPPRKDLTSDGLTFRLAPMSTVFGWPNCFDIFLRSIAKNTKDRVVTIILSGMAGDGSAVLGELRLKGGLAFAQSDAEVGSMPASAVATGYVDYYCSAADIGTLVSALSPVLNLVKLS